MVLPGCNPEFGLCNPQAPPYTDIFGSGDALSAQLTTLFAIAASIVVWHLIYRRLGIWKEFASFALFPLLLWIVFGTLDVTITTRLAYRLPQVEQNIEARWFFEHFHFWGGALASIAWISLWAVVMALLLRWKPLHPYAPLLIRTLLYALAFGHLLGFSTWILVLQPLAAVRNLLYPFQPLPAALAGLALASIHTHFKPPMRNQNRQR